MAELFKFTEEWTEWTYVFFRVLIGFMFFQHGAMKVFGIYGAKGPMSGIMLLVGICELLGGLAVLSGFFTKLAASGGALLMFIAYVKSHFPTLEMWSTLNIIGNRGEAALLYMIAFLLIATMGAKKWSLERKILGKELF